MNQTASAFALNLTVTNAKAVRDVAEAAGSVDVLFNGAGVVHAGNLLDCTEDDWTFAFDLNVASVVSSIKGAPNRFAYATTKAAVIGLTKSVAIDFIGQGMRCNAICPGTVMSPSLQERIAAQAQLTRRTFAQVEAGFMERQPMGRLGRVEEVAALAVYLASDESAFTTGTAQIIDGGMSN